MTALEKARDWTEKCNHSKVIVDGILYSGMVDKSMFQHIVVLYEKAIEEIIMEIES